jgi:hypothetical protein
VQLDAAVKIAAERKAAENARLGIVPPADNEGLMSTEDSLRGDLPLTETTAEEDAAALGRHHNPFGPAPEGAQEDEDAEPEIDAEALFNLPKGGKDDDEEKD